MPEKTRVILRDAWAEVRAAEQSAELLLYGDIGEDWWGDESNTAKSVVQALAEVAGKPLNVRINSYGGSVSDGIAIYNAIRRHTGTRSVEIDGVAMSIASMIAMAGDTVSMAENALFMVHAPWTIAIGNAPALRDVADLLDKYSDAMVSSYERKTGKPRDEMLALITDGQDHYYTASEAMDFGFVDQISDGLAVAASFDLHRFGQLPAAAAAYSRREKPMEDENDILALDDTGTGDDTQTTETAAEIQANAERERENQRIRDLGRTFSESVPEAAQIAERVITIDGTEADMKAELRKALAAGRPAPVPATPRQPRIEQRIRYKALRGFQSEEQAYRAGMWARATIFRDKDAGRWCRDAGVRMALTGTTGIGGGVLPPDEMSQAIIDLRESYGVARRYCEIVPMNSDTLTTARATADPDAYFEGETGDPTEDESEWDVVTLTARKIRTLVKIPTALAEDAVIDLAVDTGERLARSFAKKEDNCLFNGDGTLPFGGIVGIRALLIDGSHDAGKIVALTATHDTFGEIDNDDLTAVTGALPEFAETDANWFVSKRGRGASMDSLKAAAGGNTMRDLEGRPMPDYLGDPIVTSQVMPSNLTTDYSGLVMIVYGNMRQAVKLGDRRGFSLQVLFERYADQDQIGVIGRERFDINAHSLGDNTDAGPIVGLVGGAS